MKKTNIFTADEDYYSTIYKSVSDPESELILKVIERAFKDAKRLTNVAKHTTTERDALKRSARRFLLNDYEIEWGDDNWVNCSELCVMATGSDSFRAKLANELLKDTHRFLKN